jgi:simple sugar transport system permease protein
MEFAALLLIVIVKIFYFRCFLAFIPGLLKAVLNINEVILTMMMNYIAIYIPVMSVRAIRDTHGYLPQTQGFSGSNVACYYGKNSIHAGIINALHGSLIIYFLFIRTVAGYNIRVSGASPRAFFLTEE